MRCTGKRASLPSMATLGMCGANVYSMRSTTLWQERGVDHVLARIVGVDGDVELLALDERARVEPDRIAAEQVYFLRGRVLPLAGQAPRMAAVDGQAGVVVDALEFRAHAHAVLRQPGAHLALPHLVADDAAADQAEDRAHAAEHQHAERLLHEAVDLAVLR